MEKNNCHYGKGLASKTWISSFLSNLLSVIIGITITFGISFLIEQHKEKSQMREMIGLVQKELETNREWFEAQDSIITQQIVIFKIFIDNEENHWKNISSDSLVLLLGEARKINYSYNSTNSWNLFRSSEIFQKFPNKDMLDLLSKCYFLTETIQHEILEEHYYKQLEKSTDGLYFFYRDNPHTFMESLMKNEQAKYFFRWNIENNDYHNNILVMNALIDLTLDYIKDSGSNFKAFDKEYDIGSYLKNENVGDSPESDS
jgi:hypothetical protein